MIARNHPTGHPTGAQLRAARALVKITVASLAARSGLAQGTINRAESVDGMAPVNSANALLMVRILEDAGVIFLDANASLGPGVRLSQPKSE